MSLHTAVMKASQITYVGGCVNYRTGSSWEWSHSYFTIYHQNCDCALCFDILRNQCK